MGTAMRLEVYAHFSQLLTQFLCGEVKGDLYNSWGSGFFLRENKIYLGHLYFYEMKCISLDLPGFLFVFVFNSVENWLLTACAASKLFTDSFISDINSNGRFFINNA